MGAFRVHGGLRLKGEITPQGAKNEALQVISAVLLSQKRIVIHNIPDIIDVKRLIELLQRLGVIVEYLGVCGKDHGCISHSYAFCAKDIDTNFILS